MKVDFIYDVATPNGYLAHKVVPEFEKRTNTNFNYVPCLAGGIFKLTNNTPPLIANADVNAVTATKLEIHQIDSANISTKYDGNTPDANYKILLEIYGSDILNLLNKVSMCFLTSPSPDSIFQLTPFSFK